MSDHKNEKSQGKSDKTAQTPKVPQQQAAMPGKSQQEAPNTNPTKK
jgi:hypothetical protein